MCRNYGEVANFVSLSYFSRWNTFYYPTALRRVQITSKRSTNVTRDLYSRGPVKQVLATRKRRIGLKLRKKNLFVKTNLFSTFCLDRNLKLKNLDWCVIWTIERRFLSRREKYNKLRPWWLNQFALFSSCWDIYIAFKFIALTCWTYFNLCKYIVF